MSIDLTFYATPTSRRTQSQPSFTSPVRAQSTPSGRWVTPKSGNDFTPPLTTARRRVGARQSLGPPPLKLDETPCTTPRHGPAESHLVVHDRKLMNRCCLHCAKWVAIAIGVGLVGTALLLACGAISATTGVFNYPASILSFINSTLSNLGGKVALTGAIVGMFVVGSSLIFYYGNSKY